MAKYIIDLDAFFDCLDFTSLGKINGEDYTYVNNVKALVQRFPKHKVEETVSVKMESNFEVSN